jgi:3-oxoacyl-[acyl-carrier-protein] synthase III
MDRLKEVELVGTSLFLPGDPIPFEDIEKTLGAFNSAPPKIIKMIPKLLGVMRKIIKTKYSYFALDPKTRKPTENNASMATKAILAALKKASLKAEDIDCILLGTPVPDFLIPTTTTFIQEKLKIKKCVEMEIHSNCTSMSKALSIAYDGIRVGRYKNVAVVYSQNPSAYLNVEYYNQSKIKPENILLRWFLSDGASAFILSGREQITSGIKLLGVYNDSLGSEEAPGMWLNLGADNLNPLSSFENGRHHFGQDYGTVNVLAPQVGAKGFAGLLKECGIGVDLIDYLAITLPSTKLEAEAKALFKKELGMAPEKWYSNVETKGYVGGGSVMGCIDEIIEKGLFKQGNVVVGFAVESSKWMNGGFALKKIQQFSK